MPSLRQRVLDALVVQLQTITGIGFVGQDLRGYQQLTGERFPAAFVVARSDAQVEDQPFGRVRIQMPFMIVGYIKGPGGGTGLDGIAEARETFFQQVENILLSTAAETAMQTAATAHGNGVSVLGPYPEGIGQIDEGQTPPYGYFEWLGSVILHYARSQL